MNGLDIIIALIVVLIVVRGIRTGFLASALSLVGVVVGASLGSRLAPILMPKEESLFLGAGITLASTIAFAVLGDALARAIGGSLHSRLKSNVSRALDGLGGGALGFALSVTLVWVIGVFALQNPMLSGLRPAVENSSILSTLADRMPSELITQAVSELDPLPQIQAPGPDVAHPNSKIISDPDVLAAEESTVRINGIACGYGVEGSGWVAAPNLIVTNAHVVAGETATRIQPMGEGAHLRAKVVLFDRKNDIAILRTDNLDIPSLKLASPVRDEEVGVIGFPESGPLDIQPGRTSSTRRVISTDAYNHGPVERTVTGFRVYVRPGNSGGPAVNADGAVVATIFASRADSSQAGYGIPSHIVERHLKKAANLSRTASTGGCAN